MIAFKPFTMARESERPPGVPLDYPWIQVAIEEADAASYRHKGWVVMSNDDYQAHLTNLEENRAIWEQNTPQILTEIAVREAMAFGQKIITEYGAKNTLRGYTGEQVAEVASQLFSVSMLLTSGALHTALGAIQQITPNDLLTAEDITEFSTKIMTYLGLEG